MDALPPASTSDALNGPRAELAKVIPRRPRVSSWLGVALAIAFALLLVPATTADRWFGAVATIEQGKPSPITVRVPPLSGYTTQTGHTSGGGILIKRGEVPDRDTQATAAEIDAAMPHGAVTVLAYLLLVGVLGGLFTHHMRRSTYGRLLRVQLVSLALIFVLAIVVKILMLTTALSVLVVPVALFAMVPTLALDRIVGLATGTLAALVVALLVPFDVGIAILLLVQAGAAGLVIAERPKRRLRAAVSAGAAATLFTAATYPLMIYLTTGHLPFDEMRDPLHSTWLAAALGPAIATALAIVLVPPYQLLVGEITQGKLVELEDLSNPLLRQIADKAPGTWQHSLAMANMAELAANAIGANGRLVRVGAYYHDLGKSLQPKYFIENLEPGETSPHDRLPPEVSCDAIFAHVTEGIVTARKAGLHERIIDFMHMHHGNGVLEYFWGKTKEQGNPRALSVENFRYPGVPPQSRETAILSICDAVEAASRTLKKPDVGSIDTLVQRIVYGKLHLGQLDESGLSMGDLRRVAESLRETIRHANHGRIEYPWQKAQQDASAPPDQEKLTQTGPRLDSLDRPARPESVAAASKRDSADALAQTDSAGATPKLRRDSSELATKTTAPVTRPSLQRDAADSGADSDETSQLIKMEADDESEMASPVRRPTTPSPDGASSSLPTLSPSSSQSSRPRDPATPRAETNPGRDLSSQIAMPSGPMITDNLETRPVPRQDLDEDVVELRDSKAKVEDTAKDPSKVSLADLAARAPRQGQVAGSVPPANAGSTLEMDIDAGESDARMRRVTNPVEGKRSSAEAIQFATEAKEALDEAAKVQSDAPAARKRAATLPPIRPPTVPPPLGRRSPTMPPTMTVPPPDALRPPAPSQVSLPGMTAPPPTTVRPPGPNLLDDMITLRPQYEKKPDLVVKESEDGSVLIVPREPSNPMFQAPRDDDAARTQPRMVESDEGDASVGDTTSPNVDLPATSWAAGLAARLDRQIDEDFGTETPASPPTRAELQALLNTPPDPTRQQSLDELEALHRATRDRRSDNDLDFTRRAPYPTAEVDDSDIESAIEIAPPVRRNNVIGVAKKKPNE